MGARVYLPAIGRFAQVDPRAGGSANNYDFANQDPINGSDPTGAKAWWKYLCAFVAGIVITVATAGAGAAVSAALSAGVAAASLSTAAAVTIGGDRGRGVDRSG